MNPANYNPPHQMMDWGTEFNPVQSEGDEDVIVGLPARKRLPPPIQQESGPLKRAVIDLTGNDDDGDEVQMAKTSKRIISLVASDEEDFKSKGKTKKGKKKVLSLSKKAFTTQFKEFEQKQDFDKGIVLLQRCLSSRSYDQACEISEKLYNLCEPVPEKRMILLNKFEDILSLGEANIGTAFYAWVLGVLTWHTEQGHVDWRSNDFSELLRNYEESVKLGCPYARINLANLLATRDYLNEAIEHYLLYVKECPDPWKAYEALGAFYEMGWEEQPVNLEEAEKYYNLGHLAECARSTCNLARLKQNKKDLSFEEREEVCQLYKISGERGFADGWYNLGVLYMEGWLGNSDFSKAESCFRLAYKLNPTDATNATAVGEAILKNEKKITRKRSKEAIQFFEKAILLGSHEAAYRRGVLYMNGGKFIKINEKLAIKDFEKLDSFNCSDEYFDGLFRLAQLYGRVKTDDPLSLLNRTIDILIYAERLCLAYFKKNQEIKNIHEARDPIIKLLVHERTKRVELLLEKFQISHQNDEKNRILCRALYDCNDATDEKGSLPPSLIKPFMFILRELIKLNIQFAENPQCTDETKKNILKKAIKYLEELKKVNGATPEFIESIIKQMGNMLVMVAKRETDVGDQLELLKQAENLYLTSENTYRLKLKEVYTLLSQTYLKFPTNEHYLMAATYYYKSRTM